MNEKLAKQNCLNEKWAKRMNFIGKNKNFPTILLTFRAPTSKQTLIGSKTASFTIAKKNAFAISILIYFIKMFKCHRDLGTTHRPRRLLG